MNSYIETAVISNIKTKFPTARIYTGKVIEGITPDSIIVNTVGDRITLTQNTYRVRNSLIAVTVVQPTSDITDELVSCLQSFTINGVTHYPDTLDIENEDNVIRVLIDLTHIER